MPAKLRFLNPNGLSNPAGYSQVVEVVSPGRIVFISGQLGVDADGKLAGAPGDFHAQAAQAFENVKSALAAVGADFTHLVKLTNYLVDMTHMPVLRDVRGRYLSASALPASTSLQVTRFAREGALLEIDAVAVVPE